MLFARYMQVHEIKSAYGRCCFCLVFLCFKHRSFGSVDVWDSGQLLVQKIRSFVVQTCVAGCIRPPRMPFFTSQDQMTCGFQVEEDDEHPTTVLQLKRGWSLSLFWVFLSWSKVRNRFFVS